MRYFGLLSFIVLLIICWKKRCLKRYWLSLAVGMFVGFMIDIIGVGLLGLWDYPRQPFLSLLYFALVVTCWGVFGAQVNMVWDWLKTKDRYSLLILSPALFVVYECPNLLTGSWGYNAPAWLVFLGWFPLVALNRVTYLIAQRNGL